jgi:hypothetical protein
LLTRGVSGAAEVYVYPDNRQPANHRRTKERDGRERPGAIKLKCVRLKLWWKTRHARAAYRRLFNARRPRSRRPF